VRVDPPSLRRSLFELIVGDDEAAARAASSVNEHGWGDELTRLAWAWRVVPRVRERASDGVSLGDAADERIEQLAVAAAAQSTLFAYRGTTALHALEDAGVPAGAFKGVGVIAALYGTPAARMVSDVDVVIDPAALDRAIESLGDLGFALSEPIGAAGVEEWIDMMRSPMVHLRDLFVSLRNEEGFEVDLHLRFGHAPPQRMTTASLLSRRGRATIGGATVPVLAPVDLVLLSVYHALKNLMALTSTARDLADLSAWWYRGRSSWSLDELVRAAVDAKLDAPLLTFWLALARADPSGPLPEGVERLEAAVKPGTRRDAYRMLALVDHLLDDGRLSRGLLSTLSPQRARRYLAERRRRAEGPEGPGGVATPNTSERVAGLARIGSEAVDIRRLSAYRALGRAQRGFR
jgi:Uncharacterised nucleotidyltransferase